MPCRRAPAARPGQTQPPHAVSLATTAHPPMPATVPAASTLGGASLVTWSKLLHVSSLQMPAVPGPLYCLAHKAKDPCQWHWSSFINLDQANSHPSLLPPQKRAAGRGWVLHHFTGGEIEAQEKRKDLLESQDSNLSWLDPARHCPGPALLP